MQRGVVHGTVVVVDEEAVVVVVVAPEGRVVEVVELVDVLELAVELVVVVSTSATTLANEAKFSSPGVPVLTARTVKASDVPGAASAGGARMTVSSADPAGRDVRLRRRPRR